jgi:glycosyltransferase involved in cell wall biosynthesis
MLDYVCHRIGRLTVDARKAFDSGIGVVIRSLLLEFRVADIRIRAICNSESQQERLASLFPEFTYSVARAANYSIEEQLKIPKYVEGDVFWSPHYNTAIGVRIPIVSTVHDVLPLAYPGLFPGLAKQVYAKLMFRLCAIRSKIIVCVSEFTAREFSRFTGCSARKIRVVHNGVSSNWFNLERRQNTEDPYFLYVGNLKPHKNLSRLISAFERVGQTLPHRLVVVGESEGFITSDMVGLARARQTHRVTFAGSVSDEKLAELMAGAAAMVVPSLYEGFGLPALEALAAEVPVVASDIPPLREICGETAVYFDPTNIESIARCLVDTSCMTHEEQTDRSRRGKGRARSFSWKKAGTGYDDAFRKLVSDVKAKRT